MRQRNGEQRRGRAHKRSFPDDAPFSDAEAVAAVARMRRRNRHGPIGWERELWHAYMNEPLPGASSES